MKTASVFETQMSFSWRENCKDKFFTSRLRLIRERRDYENHELYKWPHANLNYFILLYDKLNDFCGLGVAFFMSKEMRENIQPKWRRNKWSVQMCSLEKIYKAVQFYWHSNSIIASLRYWKIIIWPLNWNTNVLPPAIKELSICEKVKSKVHCSANLHFIEVLPLESSPTMTFYWLYFSSSS